MLAALNRPNICAIYGFEEADGVRFLVLELVEGATLAQRLADALALREKSRGLPTIEAHCRRVTLKRPMITGPLSASDCAHRLPVSQDAVTS